MNILVTVTVVIVSITLAIVSGRSASLPEPVDKKVPDSQDNLILEPVMTGRSASRAKKVKVEGDKLLLKGKNFTNLKEMINILDHDEDHKGRSSDSAATTEPFNIVVPVARNFSSLKELFEILREGDSKPHKGSGSTNQTYVKGTEVNSSDYVIFFTP